MYSAVTILIAYGMIEDKMQQLLLQHYELVHKAVDNGSIYSNRTVNKLFKLEDCTIYSNRIIMYSNKLSIILAIIIII